jgi:flagellar motor switch/type III secretory pathway protein FliN
VKLKTYRLRTNADVVQANTAAELAWNKAIKYWSVNKNMPALKFEFLDAYQASSNISSLSASSESWIVYGDESEQWVAIKYSESDLKTLNKKLFLNSNATDDQGSQLERHLVKSFLKEVTQLASQAYEKDQQSYTLKNDLPQGVSFKKGEGHLCCPISYIGLDMTMFISSGLINTEKTQKAINKKYNLESLFGTEKVKVTASINNLKIDLNTLNSLTVGDTLTTTTKIKEPVNIYIDKLAVASGYLCQQSNQKSIQIIKNER